MRAPASQLEVLVAVVGGDTAGHGSEGAEDEEAGDQPAMTHLVSSLLQHSPGLRLTGRSVRGSR